MAVYIASDHAGFALKQYIAQLKPDYIDLGTHNESSVDYPDYAQKMAESLHRSNDMGILICGSGVGISIKANRYAWVRAALCFNEQMAQLAREHNNANVICLGARFIDNETAKKMIDIFMQTPFTDTDRHYRRVQKL